MTRTMYDAIDASLLPTGGDLYAGYVDGNWPSYNAIKARFPNTPVVGIATNPNTNDGIIGDGPPDNGTWPEWINWVQMRRAAGKDPWINTNENNDWAPGIAAFQAANVGEPHWWVANYDGNPVLPNGALMKQYASNNNYDTSSCAAYLPGIDPSPTPPPPPPPPPTFLEDKMFYILNVEAITDIYALSGGRLWHISGINDLKVWRSLPNVAEVTISQTELANLKASL